MSGMNGLHGMNGMNGMNGVNGYSGHGLSEDDFGESRTSSLKSFDAFPKTKPTYQIRTATGGPWTIVLILVSVYLAWTETKRWFAGTTTHTFEVEKGIGHNMQLNMDIVMAMPCKDLHVNVQDAAGDRILAGDMLQKDPTNWQQQKTLLLMRQAWGKELGGGEEAMWGEGKEEDVHDYLAAAKRRRRYAKTPRLKGEENSCRIYGSLQGNKVQGDFHITARGHGYMELGEHLSHDTFNFSHIVNDLSFGPRYPGLTNPLDHTFATTDAHFQKFQYYLSIVPTIYTERVDLLESYRPEDTKPPKDKKEAIQRAYESGVNPLIFEKQSHTVYTNQYAVTQQSHSVPETNIPGFFVKYDIEPILLVVSEEWGGLLALLVRLVNVISGVLVAGGWCWALSEYVADVLMKRRRSHNEGVLHGRSPSWDKIEKYT